MKLARIAAIGLLAGGLFAASMRPATAQTGSWPQWQGPNRDGISKETGLLKAWPESGPQLLWSAPGMGTGFSSVAIAGSRLYTLGDLQIPDGGSKQFIVAVDLATHKRAWTAQVGPPQSDAGTSAGSRSTPTVSGGLIYALGSSSDLVCVQASTGKEVWRHNLEQDFGGQMMSGWHWSESPLVDGNQVVCTPGSRSALLVALDKQTGKLVWKTDASQLGGRGKDGAGYSSIVIANVGGVKQYVQMVGHGLVGVSAADGKLLWSYDRVANGVANITTPIVSGDLVFGSSAYGAGSAVVRIVPSGGGMKAEEVWQASANTLQNHHGGVVLVDGYLYGGHGQNSGAPFCVDFKTGRVAWKESPIAPGSACVTAADGCVYMRYDSGKVALLAASPAGLKVLGSFMPPSQVPPSWAHPVVCGGKLYLRSGDTLLCYNVKA